MKKGIGSRKRKKEKNREGEIGERRGFEREGGNEGKGKDEDKHTVNVFYVGTKLIFGQLGQIYNCPKLSFITLSSVSGILFSIRRRY